MLPDSQTVIELHVGQEASYSLYQAVRGLGSLKECHFIYTAGVSVQVGLIVMNFVVQPVQQMSYADLSVFFYCCFCHR